MVSKRPIYSLLCNISFIEYSCVEIYRISPLSFVNHRWSSKNPRSQKEGRFRRVDKTFFPLGPGKRAGGSARVFLVLMMPLF